MFEAEAYARLKHRLTVDPVNIDEEYIQQPVLLHEAMDIAARAYEIKERRDAYAKTTRAAVAADLRDTPLPTGKSRTEGSVTSDVEINAEVMDARGDASTAGLDAQLWLALVEGMKARGFALRGLTDMAVAGFIATGSSRAAPTKQREPVTEVLARRKRLET